MTAQGIRIDAVNGKITKESLQQLIHAVLKIVLLLYLRNLVLGLL
jgi:hypothetical protein